MAVLSFFYLTVAVFACNVLAGSRMWQPQLAPRNQTLGRRFFTFNPDTNASPLNDALVWPNKQIRYCYATTEAKEALKKPLKAAHERWVTKGLGKDFTFVEASAAECEDEPTKVLHIYVTESNMATSVGYPAGNRPGGTVIVNPSMHLATSLEMGMQDQVANYAHELGHAWGLYHEHQNPNFWAGAEYSQDGTVFGTPNNNWECENLRDYTSSVIGLVNQAGGFSSTPTADKMCSNWLVARRAQFAGAANYLPMPAAMGVAHSDGKTGDDVDWTSIMIYPSGAGGIPDSSQVDGRLPILLQPNGERIAGNTYPSQLDIEALRNLYGSETSATKRNLLQKMGDATTSSFNKLFPESKGSSSCL